jgi:hypothetical protein
MSRIIFKLIIISFFLVSFIGCAHTNGNGTAKPQLPNNPNIDSNTELNRSDKLFEGKDIFPKTPIHPLRLAGAIAYTDPKLDGTLKWSFTRLLPEKPLPEPELENEIVFESLVNKGFALNVNYLSFVGVNLSGEDKAEVLIENVFRALGPEYNTQEVQDAIDVFIQRENKPNRTFYYIEAMRYITIKHRKYTHFEGEGKGSYFVSIGGKLFFTDKKFSLTDLVAVDSLQLDKSGDKIMIPKKEMRMFNHIKEITE